MKARYAYHVLRAPVLSEESTIQTAAHNKYTFRVDPRANKAQIRDAVERQWPDIEVGSENTMKYWGKDSGTQSQGMPGRAAGCVKATGTAPEVA